MKTFLHHVILLTIFRTSMCIENNNQPTANYDAGYSNLEPQTYILTPLNVQNNNPETTTQSTDQQSFISSPQNVQNQNDYYTNQPIRIQVISPKDTQNYEADNTEYSTSNGNYQEATPLKSINVNSQQVVQPEQTFIINTETTKYITDNILTQPYPIYINNRNLDNLVDKPKTGYKVREKSTEQESENAALQQSQQNRRDLLQNDQLSAGDHVNNYYSASLDQSGQTETFAVPSPEGFHPNSNVFNVAAAPATQGDINAHLQQQQVVAPSSNQNIYNVFTDSLQHQLQNSQGLGGYRSPQQVFMNSGLRK